MGFTAQDEAWMRRALGLARLAASRGEVPIGAVVVLDGQLLGWGHDEKELRKLPTAHAELLAMERAARLHGDWRLDEATLYVTLEPCPMCAGAAIHARLGRVVFGASNPRWGACGSGGLDLPATPRFNHRIACEGGLLEAESADLLRDFFRQARGGPSRE
jgi:tRNA(adenine34) deaminase